MALLHCLGMPVILGCVIPQLNCLGMPVFRGCVMALLDCLGMPVHGVTEKEVDSLHNVHEIINTRTAYYCLHEIARKHIMIVSS